MIAPIGRRTAPIGTFHFQECPIYLGYLCLSTPDSEPLDHWVFASVSANFVPRFRTVPSGRDGRASGGRREAQKERPSHRPLTPCRRYSPSSGPPDIGNPLGFTQPVAGIIGAPLGLARVLRQASCRPDTKPTLGPRSMGRLCANGPLRICQKRSQPKRLSLTLLVCGGAAEARTRRWTGHF